jgi:chromosome segregation protein
VLIGAYFYFMYLEKLEIQGFKSFANKNKLIFSGILADQKKGITVVVGPNGSGKSNIADAVRWVLGEQSTKLLRSKKSEDVIFSGSDKKNRLNMAEVSLFLNNEENNFLKKRDKEEQNILNGERAGDSIDALLLLPEIVLTRRVFRDGNSEYLINNSKVRLSDIQMFLAKANFGQKTYSVIGQGMVENFLNTSPAERKAFFDEATGVKQYQIKRDISLNKLEGSQENLAKVEMLLNEIEPRLKSLTRQVGKLKKRQFLEEELFKKQLNYYGSLWQDSDNKINNLSQAISKTEKDKKNLETSLEEDKKRMESFNQADTIGEEFYDLQKRFLFLQSEKERLQKQTERIDLWTSLEQKNKNFNSEDLNILNQEKIELEKEIQKNLAVFKGLEKGFSKSLELEEIDGNLIKLEKELSEKNRELLRIEAWMEVKLEKQGRFDLSFLLSRQTSLKNEKEDLKILFENLSEKEKDFLNKKEKAQKFFEELDSRINETEAELRRINTEESPSNIKKINQDLKSLAEKIEDIKDFNNISFISKAIQEIKGALKDLLSFSSGENYSYKIEKINNKISELRTEKNNLSESIYKLQSDHRNIKSDKERAERDLQKTTKELSELEEKIKLNKKDDDWKENEKIKKELEQELNEVILKAKDLRQKRDLGIKEKSDWQEKKSQQQGLLQKNQNKLNEINNKISLIKSDSFKSQSRQEDLLEDIRANVFSSSENIEKSNFFDIELSFLSNLLKNTDQELISLREKIDNFNKEQENKKRSLLELQRTINETENNLNKTNVSLSDYKIEMAREETRLEDLINNILDDKLELEKIKKHQVEGVVNMGIIKEDITKLKNQLELIGGIEPETEKEYEETKKRYDFLFEQTEDLNKTIKSLEKVIIELDSVIKDRFEIEFKVISEKFNEYFKILFNGGNAKIFPIKENDFIEENKVNGENGAPIAPQDSHSSRNIKLIKYLKKYNAIGFSGVDISATPPGKKISSVNMLSGGERALTAIALICAIISANPSPFVVLDEVDASLDEANSERLAKILDDLSSKTQFIVISHNRATMKQSNILYGVTMQNDGISKLLSVKLDDEITKQ